MSAFPHAAFFIYFSNSGFYTSCCCSAFCDEKGGHVNKNTARGMSSPVFLNRVVHVGNEQLDAFEKGRQAF